MIIVDINEETLTQGHDGRYIIFTLPLGMQSSCNLLFYRLRSGRRCQIRAHHDRSSAHNSTRGSRYIAPV